MAGSSGLPRSISKKLCLDHSLTERRQKKWIRCIFTNCAKTYRDEADIQFFRVPREQDVARQWIINSGNLKLLKVLELSKQQLLSFVCWNHFDGDDVTDIFPFKLKEGALPKSYQPQSTSGQLPSSGGTENSNTTIQNSQNMSSVSYQQPYVILDTHSADEGIEGEVIQELIVKSDDFIDIDEIHFEDIKPEIVSIDKTNETDYSLNYVREDISSREESNVTTKDFRQKSQPIEKSKPIVSSDDFIDIDEIRFEDIKPEIVSIDKTNETDYSLNYVKEDISSREESNATIKDFRQKSQPIEKSKPIVSSDDFIDIDEIHFEDIKPEIVSIDKTNETDYSLNYVREDISSREESNVTIKDFRQKSQPIEKSKPIVSSDDFIDIDEIHFEDIKPEIVSIDETNETDYSLNYVREDISSREESNATIKDFRQKSQPIEKSKPIVSSDDFIDIDEIHFEDIKPEIVSIDKTNETDYSLNYVREDISSREESNVTIKDFRQKSQQIEKSKPIVSSELAGQHKTEKESPDLSFISKISFKSKASAAISSMQILHREKEQWCEAEKCLALSLFYKSPSTYKFLQGQKIILPSIDTIRSWMGNLDFELGLNKTLLSEIKHKVSTMEDKDKTCALVFADVEIKSHNNGPRYLVFVLRGIYSNWNIPLAYFVGNNNTSVLRDLLNETVEEILHTGLVVCAVFGDPDYISNYPALLEELGVTPNNPYFLVKNVKIFGLMNIFSIFEVIKYHWTRNDFLFCGNQVSLREVSYALNLNYTRVSNNKRTPSDYPPIFCKTVASLIKQAVNDRHPSNGIKETAEFVKCLSNLNEVLNKRDFEMNEFLFVISKTLNKLKNGVYKILTPNECPYGNSSEELLVFKHLVTLLRAITMFCDDFQPKKYPNLIMNCPVNFFIKKMFSISNSEPMVDSFRNHFRKSFINNMMQATNEDV